MKKILPIIILAFIPAFILQAENIKAIWEKRSLSSAAYQVQFSNNGKFLAVQQGNNKISLYNLEKMDAKELISSNILKPLDGMLFMRFAPNDDTLETIYCTSTRCFRKKWELGKGELVLSEEVDSSSALKLRTNKDMSMCALLNMENYVSIIKTDTKELIKKFESDYWAYDYVFAPDDSTIAMVNQFALIHYNINKDSIIFKANISGPGYPGLLFSSDGKKIIRFYNGEIYVHDAKTGEETDFFEIPEDRILGCMEGGDEMLFNDSSGIYLWDYTAGQKKEYLLLGEYYYIDIYSQNDANLIAASNGGLIAADYETGEILHKLELNLYSYLRGFSLNSKYFISSCAVYEAGNGELEREFVNNCSGFIPELRAYYNYEKPDPPDSNVYRIVNLYDYETDEKIKTGIIPEKFWYYAIYSNDMKYAGYTRLEGNYPQNCRILDLENNEIVQDIPYAFIYSFSRTNKYAVTYEDSDDSSFFTDMFRIRETESGKIIFEDLNSASSIVSVSYDENSFYRIFKEEPWKIYVYDIKSGKNTKEISTGDTSEIFYFNVTYDNKYFLLCQQPGKLVFVNAETGDIERRFNTSESNFRNVMVSYDFNRLFASYENGSFIMWDISGIMKNGIFRENKTSEEFRVTPNPTDGAVEFNFNLSEYAGVNLTLYNETGLSIVIINNEFYGPGEHKKFFNLTSLPSGVYFCSLKAGTKREFAKLAIIK